MATPLGNFVIILVALSICSDFASKSHGFARGEIIPLSSILPKIEAIHEETKSLLAKNVELKDKISAGLKVKNDEKIVSVKEGKSPSSKEGKQQSPGLEQPQVISAMTKEQKMATFPNSSSTAPINYGELAEFNKWVEVSLEYAVKNTRATAEALKDEANSNGGTVEYTDQAVNDGMEGVKYWQAAVIFQDKTLKNEKFDPQLD